VSDLYSLDSDPATPTDAQKRLLFLQQLRQAASATPGQAAAAPNIPDVDPTLVQTGQASPPDGMLEAIRAANAAPAEQPSQQQVPARQAPPLITPGQISTAPSEGPWQGTVQVAPTSATPSTAAPWQGLRDLYANPRDTINTAIDNSLAASKGWDENGDAPAPARALANLDKTVLQYFPGTGDILSAGIDNLSNKQALADMLHSGVDTAFDLKTRARAANAVGRGVQQGLSGFNEGLGNVVFAAPDALDKASDYVAGKLAAAFGAAPAPALPSVHSYYDDAFVAPGGAPETKTEQRIRDATRSFGSDAPALLLGGGIASAGVRSGVTLAEQEAPGLLDNVRAAADSVGHIVGDKPTVREALGFVATKLKDMVPNYINALRPTNITNAVRATNMQGAADTALQRVAAHPQMTAYGDLARDWRKARNPRATSGADQTQ
jgi:hypothetical protein